LEIQGNLVRHAAGDEELPLFWLFEGQPLGVELLFQPAHSPGMLAEDFLHAYGLCCKRESQKK
jgi:hypothetical protein